MNLYRVTYQVCRPGAIGAWQHDTFEVEAESATGNSGATAEAVKLIEADGSLWGGRGTSTVIEKWVAGWFPEHAEFQVWEWGYVRIPWQRGYGYIETLEDEAAVKAGHYKVRAR
jgi:hypothetical protein